jgi:hypothetical protein
MPRPLLRLPLLALGLFVLWAWPCALWADEKADLSELLAKTILSKDAALKEVQAFCEARIPKMPEVTDLKAWERTAEQLRRDVLEKVIYRGQAAAWRDAKLGLEWLGEIEGGPGYKMKKLRYEALPGLWVPALLYEPEKLEGKAPVAMAVNGHDGNGKAADYKQVRCINMAKRGMVVLNVEWLGMGQLRGENYTHYKMNQLDLCGTPGLAPFYLSMKRGLDVLLGHKHADPQRVCVSGLSGGGWQTIIISSLDTRVTLANPVAGYSSFHTRVQHFSDLGDSEQTPSDLATVADYDHLTAMMAPRGLLLTYNSKDQCCFASGHAMPSLLAAARPVYRLYGREERLNSHINQDPGTHNFLLDNRQALYRIIGDQFFARSDDYKKDEIPSEKEVKTAEQLQVELPKDNASFHSLAQALMKDLPRDAALPADKPAALSWQRDRAKQLAEVVKAEPYKVQAEQIGTSEKGDLRATRWRLRIGDAWTVGAIEIVKGTPKGTTLVLADGGCRTAIDGMLNLLGEGQRVLAVDPFYRGESKISSHDFLFALLVAAVGERPLGIQASQLAAVARWSADQHKTTSVKLLASGPGSSLAALVAAAVEPKAISGLSLQSSLASLKEIIEKNQGVNTAPELFCFGLLEKFDIKHIAALATAPAPGDSALRPVVFQEPNDRMKRELADLEKWKKTLGN